MTAAHVSDDELLKCGVNYCPFRCFELLAEDTKIYIFSSNIVGLWISKFSEACGAICRKKIVLRMLVAGFKFI